MVLLHPTVAYRDCEDCKAWMYDEETGERALRHGRPIKRAGKPPCGFPTGPDTTRCPKGTPEAGIELSERNWLAWQHYQECAAVGQFPDDPIVKRNAAIISRVEKAAEQHRQAEEMRSLLATFRGARHR